jgi:membrane fusion protein (multidrug efflux system)
MQQTQNSGPPPAESATVVGGQNSKPSFLRRPGVIVVGTVLLALVLLLGLRYLAETLTHESTDDAFIDSDVVTLAPKVAGQIKQVHVVANRAVKAGDLLMEIDPQDLQVLLEQKEAALAAAQANVELLKSSLDLFRTEIATAEATAKQSAADAAAAAASNDKAKADLKRAEELVANKTISPQEFDSAQASATWGEANLKSQQEKAAGDKSKIGQAQAQLEAGVKAYERAVAQTRQAELDVRQAQLNLSYTRITAPEDGWVTKKAVQAGNYVQVGQTLMALVPGRFYVTANFKETQLEHIRPGQKVKITIDSVPGGPFTGHVESIQAGSGAAFSLLPPENAVGNYVKVVQRIPIRIYFDKPVEAAHVLGPGMSVVPSVRVKGYEVPEVAIVLVAVLLAGICGLVWWRRAQQREN